MRAGSGGDDADDEEQGQTHERQLIRVGRRATTYGGGGQGQGDGQLGAGFYLFPNEGDAGADGKRKSQRDAEAYGDGNAFRVSTRGRTDENIHDRDEETGARSGRWPRTPNAQPYQHPKFDAVKDTMDSGGMREMRLAPHLYDDEARAQAMETLREYPMGADWHDPEAPAAGGKLSWAQEQAQRPQREPLSLPRTIKPPRRALWAAAILIVVGLIVWRLLGERRSSRLRREHPGRVVY